MVIKHEGHTKNGILMWFLIKLTSKSRHVLGIHDYDLNTRHTVASKVPTFTQNKGEARLKRYIHVVKVEFVCLSLAIDHFVTCMLADTPLCCSTDAIMHDTRLCFKTVVMTLRRRPS